MMRLVCSLLSDQSVHKVHDEVIVCSVLSDQSVHKVCEDISL